MKNKYQNMLRHYIGDIIYGANDGIVTTFTIISGVYGAQLSYRLIIILGLINLLADGISMGASRFLSIRSKARAREQYATVKDASYHGTVTFCAFVVFGAIPLVSFFIPGFEQHKFRITFLICIIALFLAGCLQYFLNRRYWWRTGLEMATVGGTVALIAYYLGYLLRNIEFA